MIDDLTYHKWRKKLLESDEADFIYRINHKKEEEKCILMIYGDGIWQLGMGDSYDIDNFTNVDLVFEYISSKGVENYDINFDMIRASSRIILDVVKKLLKNKKIIDLGILSELRSNK